MMPPKVLPPERQCWGKQRHRTRAEAQAHKASMGYVGLESYECPHCGKWHIGHSVKRQPVEYQRWSFRQWLQEAHI